MPSVVQMVCQGCGHVTHALARDRPAVLAGCERCDGVRQVTRVFRDRRALRIPVMRDRRVSTLTTGGAPG